MIVGRRVASHPRTDTALDALEMPRRSRGARRLVGLVGHSDARSNPGKAPPCASPTAWRRSGRVLRSAPWPTRSIPPWPRRPTVSPRPSASTGPTPTAGTRPATSSSPRSRGWPGSTRSGSTVTAVTYRQRSSRRRSTLPRGRPVTGWNQGLKGSIGPRAVQSASVGTPAPAPPAHPHACQQRVSATSCSHRHPRQPAEGHQGRSRAPERDPKLTANPLSGRQESGLNWSWGFHCKLGPTSAFVAVESRSWLARRDASMVGCT